MHPPPHTAMPGPACDGREALPQGRALRRSVIVRTAEDHRRPVATIGGPLQLGLEDGVAHPEQDEVDGFGNVVKRRHAGAAEDSCRSGG